MNPVSIGLADPAKEWFDGVANVVCLENIGRVVNVSAHLMYIAVAVGASN